MLRGFLLALLLFLAACSEPAPEEALTPSPLVGADSDRLWILARASQVGDGRECKNRYLLPEDPRYQGLSEKCDFWSRNYADYLAINGFATVEHRHLQDPAYWRWYASIRQTIADCRSSHPTPPIGTPRAERDEVRRRRNACDPYDDALINNGTTTVDLGIRHN